MNKKSKEIERDRDGDGESLNKYWNINKLKQIETSISNIIKYVDLSIQVKKKC